LYYLETVLAPAGGSTEEEKHVELCDDYKSVKSKLRTGKITRFVVTGIELSKVEQDKF